MISDTAISEIESMQKAGLNPTPADIIRLNALGLLVERGPDAAALYTLRRAIRLSPSLTLREPTIAHAVFFAECLRLPHFANISDVEFVSLRAWTISLEDVPPRLPDEETIAARLDKFISGPLKPFALSQIIHAVDYCVLGVNHTALEHAEPDDASKTPPADFSPEMAVVSDALTLGLGISLKDAAALTRSRLAAIVQRAKDSRAMNGQNAVAYARECKNKALADFNRTADAIRARLTALKDAQAEKGAHQ